MIEYVFLRATDCVELRWLMHGHKLVTGAIHNLLILITRVLRVAKTKVLKFFRFRLQEEIIVCLQ